MNKTFSLVLDLLKVCLSVKWNWVYCRIYYVNLPGSINRELDSIDQCSCKSRMTISYRTGRYRRNIPFQRLNRYRNKAESYRPKYRGVSACFGYSGEFQSFSGGIFVSDRYKYNWVFLKKLDTYSNLQQLVTIIEASTC